MFRLLTAADSTVSTGSIGSETWIGEHATVHAGVGSHCVIGTGSVVTKPIPDFAVAAGVPSRVIRYRDEQSTV